MKLSDINPHIRYASIHYNLFKKAPDSVCYDCRLFFAREAKGSCIANGTNYELTNNTVIYLPPGTQYHLSLAKECLHPILIILDFDLNNEFCHLSKSLGTARTDNFDPEKVLRYDMPKEFTSPFSKRKPELYDLLFECTEEFLVQKYLYRESSSAMLKRCLIELVRDNTNEDILCKIAPVLEYIHTNYHDFAITNQSIAETFNYHPYYLSLLIKQHTGHTLHQYLISYRIRMAKKNLITTNDPINAIAWKSGFQSDAYFIKLFKQQVGVTPKTYRNEHMQFLF